MDLSKKPISSECSLNSSNENVDNNLGTKLRSVDYYKECFFESRAYDKTENTNTNTKLFIKSFVAQLVNENVSTEERSKVFLDFLKVVSSTIDKDNFNYLKPLLIISNKVLISENISPEDPKVFYQTISAVFLNLASRLNNYGDLSSIKAANVVLNNLLKLDLLNEQMFANPTQGLSYIADEIFSNFFEEHREDQIYYLNGKTEIEYASLLMQILGKLKIHDFNRNLKDTCISLVDLEDCCEEYSGIATYETEFTDLRAACLESYSSCMDINDRTQEFWENIKESFMDMSKEHSIACMALVKIDHELITSDLINILNYCIQDNYEDLVLKLASMSTIHNLLIDNVKKFEQDEIIILRDTIQFIIRDQNLNRESLSKANVMKLPCSLHLSHDEILQARVFCNRLDTMIE